MTKYVKYIHCSSCKCNIPEDEAEYSSGDFDHPLCHGCSLIQIRSKDGN
jgi:hypothetical protein